MLDSGHQSDHTQHFKGSEVTSQGEKPDLPLGMVNFLPHSEVTLSHPFFPSPSHFCPFFLPFSKSFKVQNNLCPKHPLLSCCQIRLQSVVTGLQEMRTGSVTCLYPQLDELHGGRWADLMVPGPWRMLSATSFNLGNYNKIYLGGQGLKV